MTREFSFAATTAQLPVTQVQVLRYLPEVQPVSILCLPLHLFSVSQPSANVNNQSVVPVYLQNMLNLNTA